MKKMLSSIVALILTIGIIFITTDCEVYFGEFSHSVQSATIPFNKTSDAEHTHASHHLVNDIFSEVFEDFFKPEQRVSLNFSSDLPAFNLNCFSSIWQPPKFS